MQALIADAVRAGARQRQACALVGLSVRTLERWRAGPAEDAREGPHQAPANKLTDAERRAVLATVNAAEYRNLSPNQIVPRLADAGRYLASEATIYRSVHRTPANLGLRPTRASEARGKASIARGRASIARGQASALQARARIASRDSASCTRERTFDRRERAACARPGAPGKRLRARDIGTRAACPRNEHLRHIVRTG